MKVLQVSTPRTWRGGEQQAAYLALALKKKGVAQYLLTPAGSALAERMAGTGIPVVSFSRRGLTLACTIASICKKESIDLVHTHDSHAHSAAVLSAALLGNKTPVVVSRRVDFPISRAPLSRWKYNHPLVKKIICVSDMIRQITAKDIRNKNVLCVIHSGIDLHRYDVVTDRQLLRRELGISDNTRIIGNLSALADHKDYPTFLRTAAAVLQQRSDVIFIIAGAGPEEASIRQQIGAMGLTDHVKLLGFRQDVPAVMKALDLFLITSATEGLGTIVLEAFAAGVPVVATMAGGIPELVKDEVTGLTAPVGDDHALAQQVLRLLNDPMLAAKLSHAATAAATSFTFEQTAEKTLLVYREILKH